MKLDSGVMPVNDTDMYETTKCRSRMRKAAPPPPQVAPPRPLSNGGGVRPPQGESRPAPLSSTPGEDCAFDELLEGRMDLEIVLPDNRRVNMTVDRRTPMMDLLVQATTSNKISPGGHVINIISSDENNVHYKPNTPIGSLDANTVYIVPKTTVDVPVRRMPKLANQPFEQQTFRLQVNLPRNQRMVLRVSPRITLAELKRQICNEKELDHSSHHLVHPAHPDTVLDLNSTLEVYGCAEISLMSNSGLRDSIRSTSTNFIAYPRVEEEKKKKGILRLFSRKKKEVPIDTNGISSRGVSPSRSEISNRNSFQPKLSTKRKPAPAPPPPVHPPSPPLVIQSSSAINSRPESEISAKTDEVGSTVSHSRHSSDSSGYHEPSVFSDCSENKSPEASIVHGGLSGHDSPSGKEASDSITVIKGASIKESTNLKNVPSFSNTSIVSTARKRKAPLPPGPVLHEVETPPSPELPIEDQGPLTLCLDRSLAPLSTPIENKAEIEDSTESDVIQEVPEQVEEPQVLEKPEQEPPQPTSLTMREQFTASMLSEVQTLQSTEPSELESEALDYLEHVLHESENFVDPGLSPELDKSPPDSEIDSQTEQTTAICVPEDEADHMPIVPCSQENVDPSHIASPEPNTVPIASNPPSLPCASEATDAQLEDSGIHMAQSFTENSQIPDETTSFSSVNCETETLTRTEVEPCDVSTTSTSSDASNTPAVPLTEVPEPLKNSASFPSSEYVNVDNSLHIDNGLKGVNEIEGSKVPNLESPVEIHECRTISHDETVSPSSKQLTNQNIPPDPSNEIKVCMAEPVSESKSKVTEEMPLGTAGPSEVQHLPDEINKFSDSDVSKEMHNTAISPDASLNDMPQERVTTPLNNRKLVNFAMSCYKSEKHDIYSVQPTENRITPHNDTIHSVNDVNLEHNINDNKTQIETEVVQVRYRRSTPDVKIVPFEDRKENSTLDTSLRSGIKGQVQERCVQLGTLPLTGRSASLFNLTPQKKSTAVLPKPKTPELPSESLKRAQSDQNLSQDKPLIEDKTDFIQEQKRLHEEYLKLQAQFISWQKQLLNNQSLLQSEQIMPKLSFPAFKEFPMQLENMSIDLPKSNSPSPTKSPVNPSLEELRTRSLPRPKPRPVSLKDPHRPTTPPVYQSTKPKTFVVTADINTDKEAEKTEADIPNVKKLENEIKDNPTQATIGTSPSADDAKSRTLPRQINRPASALETSRTMTLNRHTRPKSQVVSVTIGSWQQRNQAVPDINSASVASSRSMFQSLENIPQAQFKATAPQPTEMKMPKQTNVSVERNISKQNTESVENQSKKVKPVETVVSTVEVHKNQPKVESNLQEKAQKIVSKPIELQKQPPKTEAKPQINGNSAYSKFTKPFVRLSSMKDETRPPPIQGLKKWPLPDINEKESVAAKMAERSIWEELKASAKRPAGGVREKVHRAEVDLRKHRTPKKETVATEPKSKDPEDSSSRLHITKVNIFSDNKAVNGRHFNGNSDKSKSSKTSTMSVPVKPDPLNSELKNFFSKRASAIIDSKDENTRPAEGSNENEGNEKRSDSQNNKDSRLQTVTMNGNMNPPPPPPPPVSSMPTIPPAASIPMSSQLVMDNKNRSKVSTLTKQGKTRPKMIPSKDPRDELMLEIRGFGGKQALRKIPVAQAGWHLKVYGPASTANS